MKISCPKCAQTRTPSMLSQMSTYTDNEGFLAGEFVCPNCALHVGLRLMQESPPCKRCGHAERTYIRGSSNNLGPGSGAPLEVKGEDYANLLKTLRSDATTSTKFTA